MRRGDYVNITEWEGRYTVGGVYVGDNLDGSVQIQSQTTEEGEEKGKVHKGDPSTAVVVEDDDLFYDTLEFVQEQRKTIFIP